MIKLINFEEPKNEKLIELKKLLENPKINTLAIICEPKNDKIKFLNFINSNNGLEIELNTPQGSLHIQDGLNVIDFHFRVKDINHLETNLFKNTVYIYIV